MPVVPVTLDQRFKDPRVPPEGLNFQLEVPENKLTDRAYIKQAIYQHLDARWGPKYNVQPPQTDVKSTRYADQPSLGAKIMPYHPALGAGAHLAQEFSGNVLDAGVRIAGYGGNYPDGEPNTTRDKAGIASNVIRAAMAAASPSMAGAAARAPLQALKIMLPTMAASYGAGEVADVLDAEPEYKNLAQDLPNLLGMTAVASPKIRAVLPGMAKGFAEQPFSQQGAKIGGLLGTIGGGIAINSGQHWGVLPASASAGTLLGGLAPKIPAAFKGGLEAARSQPWLPSTPLQPVDRSGAQLPPRGIEAPAPTPQYPPTMPREIPATQVFITPEPGPAPAPTPTPAPQLPPPNIPPSIAAPRSMPLLPPPTSGYQAAPSLTGGARQVALPEGPPVQPPVAGTRFFGRPALDWTTGEQVRLPNELGVSRPSVRQPTGVPPEVLQPSPTALPAVELPAKIEPIVVKPVEPIIDPAIAKPVESPVVEKTAAQLTEEMMSSPKTLTEGQIQQVANDQGIAAEVAKDNLLADGVKLTNRGELTRYLHDRFRRVFGGGHSELSDAIQERFNIRSMTEATPEQLKGYADWLGTQPELDAMPPTKLEAATKATEALKPVEDLFAEVMKANERLPRFTGDSARKPPTYVAEQDVIEALRWGPKTRDSLAAKLGVGRDILDPVVNELVTNEDIHSRGSNLHLGAAPVKGAAPVESTPKVPGKVAAPKKEMPAKDYAEQSRKIREAYKRGK